MSAACSLPGRVGWPHRSATSSTRPVHSTVDPVGKVIDIVHELDAYATDVVEGRIPAGKYHRLSCARHLRDRAREDTPNFSYRFDAKHADRFFRFASKLKHYKGRQFAGRPIE